MVYSYLDKDNIFTRYDLAKKYTMALTKPFPEFERIARNRPHDGIDPSYPKTTDGTTASIVRKTPKRVIQQLPTGKVIAEDGGWLGIVSDYILTEKIVRHANEDYDLIQKCWLTIEGSLTFGSTVTYTPFLNHDGYFCPDLTIPYWGDVFLQRGKKSGGACSYVFMRSWWQKADIEALIDSENKLSAGSKKKGSKYQPTWDTAALQSVLDDLTDKDTQSRTPVEKERALETTGIELVTGFQKGVGAKFYTFNPGSQTIVRTKVNKDPRGKMPLSWMYGDIDGENPLGRGIVELIGGLQNLIDSDMQMYQFNRALALAPPVVKYGNIGNFKFAPNTVVKASSPTDKIEPLVIDTSAIANYPALYGMQKSQLLNLVNSPDTSISSNVGNPSFSKTTAGVQQQAQTISVDDNYVTKMFETWFEAWAEGAINLYYAERSGKEELQLDKTTADRLRELPGFNMSLLSEDNKIMIDYDTDTPVLKFRVDPSTTKKKDGDAQVISATNLLDMVMKYPQLNSNYGGSIDVDVLTRRIVVNSGIDDPEQVAPQPTAAQIQSKIDQKNQVSPFSPMFDKPSIRMNFPDLPMAAQIQVLANAGVHVSSQDMLQGPVVDPNMRGVMNPMSDPNVTMPGGQPASSAAPIDLGDIYKTTTDPTVKAQIEQLAGLSPNPTHVTNQLETNASQHVANQVSNLNTAATALMPQTPQGQSAPTTPQPAQPQQPHQAMQQEDAQEPQGQTDKELSPLDQQLIAHLQALGVPASAIQQAIQMLEQGASPEQVLQAIGLSNG